MITPMISLPISNMIKDMINPDKLGYNINDTIKCSQIVDCSIVITC